MSNTEATANSSTPLEGAALEEALRKQLEYYFSKENLMTDKYLLSQMNAEMFVPITVLEGFKLVKALTSDHDLIVKTLKDMTSVVVDETGTLVKPNIKAHRNTIILREIPSTTPVEDIKNLFNNEKCGKIVEVKSEVGDNWYIVLDSDDSAMSTLDYIRTQSFNGQPIKARLKTENTFRSLYASALSSAAQTGQNIQVAYPTKPPQENQGYTEQEVNNYRGYNGRGGYRKRGYGRGGSNQRGGYKGHINNRDNNQNNANIQTRKRGNSGKELKLGSEHFPPLPSQDKVSGYQAPFKMYSKQEITEVLQSIKETQKPEIPDVGVTLDKPNTTLEVTKPWPVIKSEEKKEEAPAKETTNEVDGNVQTTDAAKSS